MDQHSSQPWYRTAVLYQIYPLSFADSNGDGYGDLNGIIQHLDYLNDGSAESLGVEAIWLSPVYRSPMADWGYDVADYQDIDQLFGDLATFDRLINEAHRRGIKVILDFVPNHTSSQHPWFVDSRSSRSSAHRDWYIWADAQADGSPPNNWLSRFGGSAWDYDETSGQYYLHTFLKEQPDLNWRNPKVRQAMFRVLDFWLARGVDGFRADAVVSLIKDPQFRDNPPNPAFIEGKSDPADRYLQTYSAMVEEVDEVIGGFCEVLSRKPGAYLVSEAYLDIPGMQKLYAACREHPVHAPFNFNLMTLPWSAGAFREFIDEYDVSLGPEDWPNYVLGNHDRSRLASRLGQSRARLMTIIQLTLRGMPVIYNGDELGLEDGRLTAGQLRDPWGRHAVTRSFGRDVARTPMPWNDESAAGFTTGKPWLPLSSDNNVHNVAAESHDPESMLELYRHLIHLKKQLPALYGGTYRSIDSGNDQVFAYVRESTYTRCYMIANFSDQPQTINLGAIGQYIAGTHDVHGTGEIHSAGEVTLLPFEGRLYEMRRSLS